MRLEGGDIRVDQINYPDKEIAPGGTITVEVAVTNTAITDFGFTQDRCYLDTIAANGYAIEVEVNPEWAEAQYIQDCIRDAGVFGNTTETYTFNIKAPDYEGSAFFDISVILQDSRKDTTETRSVVVSEEGGQKPGADPDDDINTGSGTEIFGVPAWQIAVAGGATAGVLIATR